MVADLDEVGDELKRRMSVKSIASALFVVACMVTASAQESAGPSGPAGRGSATGAVVRESAKDASNDVKDPQSIDGMIAAALKSNPDILVAESKVREAEAELNRVRMKVTQDVMALQNRREAARLALLSAESALHRKSQMHQAGTLDVGAYEDAKFELMGARHAVATVESESKYLLGEGSGKSARQVESKPSGDSASNNFLALTQRPPLTTTDCVFLAQTMSISLEKALLPDAFEKLKTVAADLGTMVVIDEEISGLMISVDVKDMTIEKFLTLLTDRMRDSIAFVFRPYGVFVTTPRNAQRLWGAAIPAELPVMRAAQPPVQK
jgi:hypothetical protein